MTAATFICEGCNKTHVWKPELAGKRGKCKCGVVMTVPPQPESAPDSQDDGLYDIVEDAPPKPRPKPVLAAEDGDAEAALGPVAVPAKKTKNAAAVLPYRSAPTARELERSSSRMLIDPKRDVYAPIAFGVVGIILYLGYYAYAYHVGIGATLIISTGLAVLAALETTLLIGFAFTVAGPLGVSFGSIGTAILKLAATVLLCDGITTWVDGFVAKFAFGFTGSLLGFGAIGLPIALGVYWVCFIYLFSMDPGDSWFVVIILSIFYCILRTVLIVILLNLILHLGGAASGAASVIAGGSPKALTTAQQQQMDEVQAARDHDDLKEARDFATAAKRDAEIKIINEWYDAGATNVWYEEGHEFSGNVFLKRLVVELPADKTKRPKCFDIAREWDANNGWKDDMAIPDTGDPYLMMGVNR